MHALYFLDESVLPVTKNRGRERGNGPSALGCKMDGQTYKKLQEKSSHFVLLAWSVVSYGFVSLVLHKS